VQIDDALVDCFDHGNASIKGAIANQFSSVEQPNALVFSWQVCASSKARRSPRSPGSIKKEEMRHFYSARNATFENSIDTVCRP
jgi:hypothetical protein